MKPGATWIVAFAVVLAGWLYFYYNGLPLPVAATIALCALVFSGASLVQLAIARYRRRSSGRERKSPSDDMGVQR